MHNQKMVAGSQFPELVVTSKEGSILDIGIPSAGYDWRLLVVYRGKHCPMCTKYLKGLEIVKEQLLDLKIDVVAVSGDSQAQLQEHATKLYVSFPLYCGLTIEQMKELGLYISHPRSAEETDHPFAEPGLFVINEQHTLQVVNISNNPFVRPALEELISGLRWIRGHDYPIRGTYSYDEA